MSNFNCGSVTLRGEVRRQRCFDIGVGHWVHVVNFTHEGSGDQKIAVYVEVSILGRGSMTVLDVYEGADLAGAMRALSSRLRAVELGLDRKIKDLDHCGEVMTRKQIKRKRRYLSAALEEVSWFGAACGSWCRKDRARRLKARRQAAMQRRQRGAA